MRFKTRNKTYVFPVFKKNDLFMLEKNKKSKVEVNEASFLFSLPPSINNCYRAYRGRMIKSSAYRFWQHIEMQLYKYENKRVTGNLKVEVVVHTGKGWRVNRDLDNLLKPLLDMLILIGVIEDDNSKVIKEIVVKMNVPKIKSFAVIEVNVTKL